MDNTLIARTEKTSEGLRTKLFDVLDALLADKISIDRVEAVCAVTDSIINSAKAELEVQRGVYELEEKKRESIKLISNTIDNLATLNSSVERIDVNK